MVGVQGIQPIGPVVGYILQNPEATPEQIHGSSANPAHANYGEEAEPYSWQATQYSSGPFGPIGPNDKVIGSYPEVFAGGMLSDDPTADRTPYTHAAPYPKNAIGDQSVSPENISRQLYQNRAIHASNLGSSLKHLYTPTMLPQNDQWTEVWNVSPGDGTLQSPNVPQQIGMSVGGFGSRDRVQSHAGQNSYGYDSAHMHRRFATGSIPGNYQMLIPGSRPMIHTVTGMRNFPTGSDTPFAGDNTGDVFGIDGAILQATPTEYVAPPQPLTVPASWDPASGTDSTNDGTTGWAW
jgi:hypothetical protein